MSKCSINKCNEPSHARSLCHKHYWRLRQHGDANHTRTFMPRVCSIDECITISKSRGWCEKHYCRYRKYGNPNAKVGSFNKHGMSQSKEYNTWSLMKVRCLGKDSPQYKGYYKNRITVCDRWINSFTDFYEDMGAAPSNTYTIDRINNNGNYEPGNCRWATRSQQSINKGIYANNTTGFRGVYKKGLGWTAGISKDKKMHWLGTFNNPEDAARAYNNAALIHHGSDAKLNILS